MRNKMLLIVAVLVIGTLLFAATEETSRLKITATVTEGPGNNGIHIMAGNATTIMAGMTGSANEKFKALFDNQSSSDLTLDAGDNIMTSDVTGVFSVLVYRSGGNNTITVHVSATPLRKEDGSANYLPYKITELGKTNAIINTLGDPSGSTAGASYVASPPSGSVGVRDARVFEYLIPKATAVDYG